MSWSSAENQRFLELLEKYPAEKSQRKRWEKISNELGSKTLQQVASKAQKQFKKMRKIRKPIPGRQEPGRPLKSRSDQPDEATLRLSQARQQRQSQFQAEKSHVQKGARRQDKLALNDMDGDKMRWKQCPLKRPS